MLKTTLLTAAVVAGASFAEGKRLIEGNPESTVRVVIYEDLECSDCAAFRRMLDDELLPKYGRRVAFEHLDFPIARHKWARQEAVAARFLLEERGPDLALRFRRDALASIKEVRASGFESWLAAWAKKNGVDPAQAAAALEDKQYADAVEADYQAGVARGVARTPTAFVNGVPFVETFTVEEISKAIDAALGP